MTQQMSPTPFRQAFFHGTRADLQVGALIVAGNASNYGAGHAAGHNYFSGTLDAAIWGAELAKGDGAGRIYVVEPTGDHEDDPNLTDQKFPGNPSQSFRSRDPLRIIGEVVGWHGHPEAQIAAMKAHIDELEAAGIRAMDD